ncbi:hypothetical protein EV1_004454 [Malus domestica]
MCLLGRRQHHHRRLGHSVYARIRAMGVGNIQFTPHDNGCILGPREIAAGADPEIPRLGGGGFSLNHPPYQSPPRCTDSYVDAMKDLHPLPWLERFVFVISDNYYKIIFAMWNL